MGRKSSGRSWSFQGRNGLPDRLRRVQSPYVAFDNARDPSQKLQRDAMKKTEAKRRGEQGEGSQMVKLHKPFPELRPKSLAAQQSIRRTFNKNWHAEQKRAASSRKRKDAFDKVDQAKAERSSKQEQLPRRGLER